MGVALFARLRERFSKAEDIPGADAVSKACFEALYLAGLVDFATFDLRTQKTYHDALASLVGDAHDGTAAIEELLREQERQRLILELSKAMSALVEGGAEPSVVAEDIRKTLSESRGATETPKWGEYITGARTEMRSLLDRGVELTTGLAELDGLVTLRRNNTTIVAAPTSQGKTAFALRMVNRAAERGLTAAMMCCEDWSIIPMKLASHRFQVPLDHFTRYHAAMEDQRKSADSALDGLSKVEGIHIFKEMPLSLFEAELSKIKPDLVVIDYAQRYAEVFGGEGKREAIGKLACDFESLVRRHNSYGILCSQIRRREITEGGRPRKPSLYDLKESGELENYASTVLMLYWPWKDAVDKSRLDKSKYYVNVEKDKTGQCGEVEVIFDGNTQTHRDKYSAQMEPDVDSWQ